MIEIRLNTEPTKQTLITFDGHVIEFFYVRSGTSTRFHVAHIAKIEIETNNGEHFINMTSKYVDTPLLGGFQIRDEALNEMQSLVKAVREAMASYQ